MRRSFIKGPTRHLEPVLHDIADAAEVGDIETDLGGGNNTNRSPDDAEGGAL